MTFAATIVPLQVPLYTLPKFPLPMTSRSLRSKTEYSPVTIEPICQFSTSNSDYAAM